MNKFISLIIGLAIIYAIMTNKIMQDTDIYNQYSDSTNKTNNSKSESSNLNQKANESYTSVNPEFEGNFFEKVLSKLFINALKTDEGKRFVNNMVQPLKNENPLEYLTKTIKINELNVVNQLFSIKNVNNTNALLQESAYCGQIVTVEYHIIDENGVTIKEQVSTSRLGSKDIGYGLENVIIGMKVGDVREAVIYSSDIKDNINTDQANTAYRVVVTLKKIQSPMNIKNGDIRIWDDEIAYIKPYLCGDEANLDIKITKINGDVLYDTKKLDKKITMKIGDPAYPALLSYSIFNKMPIGTRTILAQGKYLHNIDLQDEKLDSEFQALISKVQKQDFVIVDLHNFYLNK